MGKATAGRPFVARVLLPEGREVEFSLDHGPFLGKSPISWLDLLGSKGIIKMMQHGLIVMVNTDLICHLNDLVNHNRRLMENY